VVVGTASFTTSPGGVTATGITLPLTDLCSAAPVCTLSCTATVPATGTTTSAVSFASTATASNCTGTPTFDWNFGDGTAHSTAQNPSHTYAAAGNYSWSLTATVDGVPCSQSGSISISAGGGTSTLATGTGSGTAGAGVCVDLTLTNSGAPVITAFTADLTYDASMLTPTGVTTPVGGKLVGGNIVSAGTYRITLYGGTGTLSSGAVANVCFATTAGQCATYPLAHAAGTPTASDASANPVAITGTAGSITTTGCSGCTLTCTATVPATGTTTSSVAFASTATASNCAGTPTFDWDFGDSTAHSTSQNPSHTYASTGTFNWVLTVSVNGVPCSKNGSITISGGGSSGAPWAWGYNSSGQLGDGTTTERLSPVSISSLSSVRAFEAGESFSLALKTDGTVAAWGYNFFGQLGDGTYNNSSLPVSVSSLTSVTAIAAGRNFALALKSDGTVWAWGHNSFGQIGGAAPYSNVPVVVAGLTGVTAIACGGSIPSP
jgi:PKD repeat protein